MHMLCQGPALLHVACKVTRRLDGVCRVPQASRRSSLQRVVSHSHPGEYGGSRAGTSASVPPCLSPSHAACYNRGAGACMDRRHGGAGGETPLPVCTIICQCVSSVCVRSQNTPLCPTDSSQGTGRVCAYDRRGYGWRVPVHVALLPSASA